MIEKDLNMTTEKLNDYMMQFYCYTLFRKFSKLLNSQVKIIILIEILFYCLSIFSYFNE
jgi:hypothetical protein